MPVTIKATNLKYKDTSGEYVGVNSISDMTTAEQLAAINQAGTAKKNAIDTAGANHLSAINTAGTTQTTAVNNAGATQVAAVNSAGATKVAAVQDKGDEVLESIPSDYSELTEDVNSLKSAINALEPVVDDIEINKADVIVSSASGSIASFSDGADGMPVKELTVGIEPVQDLHGYDAPWPAGGGKNLLQVTAVDDNTTHSGLTFTTNPDGTIKVTGTSTGANFVFGTATLPAGTYMFSHGTNLEGFYLNIPGVKNSSQTGSEFTLSEEQTVTVKCYPPANGTVVNGYLEPMIRLSTSASGYAPYSNICPITGWTEAKVTRTGINLWDFANSRYCTFPFKKGMTIYVRQNTNIPFSLYAQTAEQVGTSSSDNLTTLVANNTYGITLEKDYARLLISSSAYGDITSGYVQITFDNVAEMIPFVGAESVTIQLGQTVYGGTLTVNEDGTGQLVVDRASVDMGNYWYIAFQRIPGMFYTTGGINVLPNSVCVCSNYKYTNTSIPPTREDKTISSANYFGTAVSVYDTDYSDTATFKAAMSGVQLVYELATPITYNLTALEVLETLKGVNNIWADTGDTTVTYRADTKLYIDNRITQAIAAALNA